MANQVAACVKAFILAILCGNPILKGAFVTAINGVILDLDVEIALLTAQLARLNIINAITNIAIKALQAQIDKVTADLNLILEPMAAAGSCAGLNNLNEAIQNSAVGKTFNAFQKLLYDFNRRTNLVNLQNAIIQKKQQLRDDLQNFVDNIASLCP